MTQRASAPLHAPPASGGFSELVARCSFPPRGSDLVCAVSGGPDSLALLVLAVWSGCAATAVHVDHGLRPGSAAEAEVVAAAAAAVGARFRSVRVEVAQGPNLEARAREARKSVLAPDAATGHTMDDQAETVIINFLRGAGLDGLAGMRSGPLHPILDLRRSETVGLCSHLRLETVDDPSNRDRRFLRNKVRLDLLPMMNELAGRDLVPVLARQARVLAEERDFLDELAGRIDATDVRLLREAPMAVARRAVRGWLQASSEPGGSASHPPDLAAVDRVLDVAAGEVRSTEVAPGTRIARTNGRLRSSPVSQGPPSVVPGCSDNLSDL